MKKSYGYKVCYCEHGKSAYIRHYKTYTYKQAINALCFYRRYPPKSHKDNHKLKRPKWKIIPISKNEVLAGIWREDPF